MERVFVLKDQENLKELKELFGLLEEQGCSVVRDDGWPLPAYRLRGDSSLVRGFAAYCLARFGGLLVLE